MIYTAPEISRHVGDRVRALRLSQRLTQIDLAARAGVSHGTVRRLEATGQVSFDAIVRTALALRAEDGLLSLFPAPEFATLDDALKPARPARQRAPRRPRETR